MQNYYRAGVSLKTVSLFLWSRGKVVYILPCSDPTLDLLLVGFTEYDDDGEDDDDDGGIYKVWSKFSRNLTKIWSEWDHH
ncbi:hypothetical protein Hanom_Chr04g00377311 [Helianthus anomalus]